MKRTCTNIREYLKRSYELSSRLYQMSLRDGDEKQADHYLQEFGLYMCLYEMLDSPEHFGRYAKIMHME